MSAQEKETIFNNMEELSGLEARELLTCLIYIYLTPPRQDGEKATKRQNASRSHAKRIAGIISNAAFPFALGEVIRSLSNELYWIDDKNRRKQTPYTLKPTLDVLRSIGTPEDTLETLEFLEMRDIALDKFAAQYCQESIEKALEEGRLAKLKKSQLNRIFSICGRKLRWSIRIALGLV